MKKSLLANKSIYCVTLGLLLIGACQRQPEAKATEKEPVGVAPSARQETLLSTEGIQNSSVGPDEPATSSAKGEIVKPIGQSKSSQTKATQQPTTAPAHSSPNPDQLDSLRNAMDKLREQEVVPKRRKGDNR